MAVALNTFFKGLNKDTAYSKYSSENYYHLKNFRVITDGGMSTFGLETEKGTALSFTIPDVGTVYEISVNDNTQSGSVTINANSILVSPGFTINSLYDAIIADTGVASDISNGYYNVYLATDTIYLVELDQPVILLGSLGVSASIIVNPSSDLKIIGWGTLRDDVVIFTTSEIQPNPTLSTGQIWKVRFNEQTEEIVDAVNGNLVPSKHLVYNHNMNLSTYHRIGDEVVGRYESASVGRVYWTDNNNRIRTANIYDENLFATLPENLDIVADVKLSKPKIDSIGSGSIPTGSTVQYYYRLVNTNGTQTLYSPGSIILKLTSSDPTTQSYQDYVGTAQGSSNSRSVTYTINNIDTRYDVIEHIAVIWENKDVPIIAKFKEEYIPSSGSITVTHSGDEDVIDITPNEFNALSAGPQKCKSITYKDNRLVVANISTEQFDVDFDARAYRFNSLGICNLYNETGLLEYSLTGTSLLNTISNTADCLNYYNYEDTPNWDTIHQNKYKSDGITLGGEGINVSYTFTTQQLVGRKTSSYGTQPPFIESTRYTVGDIESREEGDYDLNGQFKSFKSPIVEGLFTGYARGEVYRFGLVLYSKKGNPSFVKWIGDIKFPEPYDGYNIGDGDNDNSYLNSLGIQFSIDLSSVIDKVSAVEIVRVERTTSDKTRLGTGTVLSTFKSSNVANNGFDNNVSQAYRTLYSLTVEGLGDTPDFTNNTRTTTSIIEIDGSNKHCFVLADRPRKGYQDNGNFSNTCLGFISPTTQYSHITGFSINDGDYIKDYGYYVSGYPYLYHNNDLGGALNRQRELAFYCFTGNYIAPALTHKRYKISTGAIAENGAVLSTSSLNSTNNNNFFGSNEYMLNASYGIHDPSDNDKSNYPLGIGDKKAIITLYTTPTESYFSPDSQFTWEANRNPTGDPTLDMYWKEVSYCRFVANQYGGKGYEARSKNDYISTGAYFYSDINNQTADLEVYGGDTFVNYFDSEYLQMFNSNVDRYKQYESRKLGFAVGFPCESSINYDLRSGYRWAKDRNDGGVMNTYSYSDNIYYRHYDQDNTARRVYVSEDFLSNFITEHSHMIWASEEKIDGELLDSWRVFLPNNSIEVEGVYGPINKVINFRDRVLYYQSKAVGVAQINEKSTVPDTTGTMLTVGTGGVLVDFDYISTSTGAFHQFSIVKSGGSIYHFDAYLKKIFKLEGGLEKPISDIKGMSSYFASLDGAFIDTDLTLDEVNEAAGVHTVFDPRYNRVIFTIEGAKQYSGVQAGYTYEVGDIVYVGGVYYENILEFTAPSIPLLPSNDSTHWRAMQTFDGKDTFFNAVTITYNENLDAFEGFYGYTPKLYLNTGRRIISPDRNVPNTVYQHNKGNYCRYYSLPPEDSEVTILVNKDPMVTKVFNNIEWYSESYDSNGDELYNDTLDSLRVYNEYQDTGERQLSVNTNVKRFMRKWRVSVPRHEDSLARIRNPHTFVTLKYDNGNNQRFILGDIITYYTPAPF